MSLQSERLPNLDALRFVAFSAVMLAHVYHPLLAIESNESLLKFYELMQYGVWGVNFFFVLSGFLITRLLLNDVERLGRPDIIRFYKRRILRIWPLYFIVIAGVALYYILLQIENTNTHWLYFILFLGNYHILIEGFPYSPALANLWTIAVEEQFYLICPLLIFFLRKNIWWVGLTLIIISALFRLNVVADNQLSDAHVYFNTLSVMNDLAVGILLACFTQRLGKDSIRVNGLVQIVLFVGLIGLVVILQFINEPVNAMFERIVLAALFAFIVFQQVFISNRHINIQSLPTFSYLGTISYGLYMFHAFAMQAVNFLFAKLGIDLVGINGLIIYPLCVFIVTTLTASLSYKFVEKNFLKLKSAWAS